MILMGSHYFKTWYQLVDLRESTKRGYSYNIKKFDQFLQVKGFNPNDILDFNRFYLDEQSGETGPIDVEFIDQFIEHLKNNGSSPHVLCNVIEALKNFFLLLKLMGLIMHNPMLGYPNPYHVREINDWSLTKEQCEKMLKVAYNMDPFTKQFYVLILLLLTCGLRASETIKLRKSQVIFDRNVIEITRGQKTYEGVVYMTEKLSADLRNYFNHPFWQRWSDGEDKEVFFIDNKPLKQDTLLYLIKYIALMAGIKRNVSPHCLRYSMASLMLGVGINISSIQKQLRHRFLATTLLYLPPTAEIRALMETYTEHMKN